MALVLTIENKESLPNGSPVSVRVERESGLDIGRSAAQGWILPDPSRFISGKHCEVRYRDDSYWLYDISANGTFLDSSTSRLQAPHRLSSGDRFTIGSYIIAVAVEPEKEPEQLAAPDLSMVETVPAGTQEWIAEPALPVEPASVTYGDMGRAEEQAWREPPAAPRQDDARQQETLEAEPSGDEFIRRFAAGAGVPEQIFARRDGMQLAEELGTLLRTTTECLVQLLGARSEAERLARVSARTTVRALDNNPLKLAPGSEEALRIMFGPRSRGYLDARRAFEGAFTDLKTHQVNTFAAMQQAVRMLVEDLDPKGIEAAAGSDIGLSGLLGSRKARLWDLYVARWQAQALRHDDGLSGAFTRYFGECYDQAKEAEIH